MSYSKNINEHIRETLLVYKCHPLPFSQYSPFIEFCYCLVPIPRKLNNSWMAADLSHLLSVDKIKHKLPDAAASKCTARYANPGFGIPGYVRFSRWRHELLLAHNKMLRLTWEQVDPKTRQVVFNGPDFGHHSKFNP